MNIGDVIKENRKRQNLTQQQVASYLNVTAPAVNKWENGISYPDIMILSPRARILKIDVNTLLEFNKELTDSEINKFTREVSEMVISEGYDKAFKRADGLIKEYLFCGNLILKMTVALRINLMASEITNKEEYEEKIISWLDIAAGSSEEKISSMAKLELSSIYRIRKQYEKAEEFLNKIPERGVDKRMQQAVLYEETDRLDEAYTIYESIAFQDGNEALMSLSLIINRLCINKEYDLAKYYIDHAKKIASAFDMGEFYEYQFDLSMAVFKKDKERTIEMAKKVMNSAGTMNNYLNSKLYSHMNVNKSNYMTEDKCIESIRKGYAKNKELDFVKDDPRMKSLLGIH